MEIFNIERLTYFYPRSTQPALKDVDLTITAGEFLFIAGASGSGKTTLAKVIAGLIPDFYGGEIKGRVLFKNKSLFATDKRELRREIGMVFQEPEKQLIMQRVESELAFGLENLGLPPSEIRRRMAETARIFRLESLLDRKTSSLSSGEKQKTVLASVLAMGAKLIVLDEPASNLDGEATEEVFLILERLKNELGYTIILIEQKTEKYLKLADRVIFLDGGEVADDSSSNFGGVEAPADFSSAAAIKPPGAISYGQKQKAIEIENLSFSYNGAEEAVLENISFPVEENDFVCILGRNGAGKTTLLKLIMGFLKPAAGRVSVFGKDILSFSVKEKAETIGYLSHNADSYFLKDTLEEELKFTLDNLGEEDGGVIGEVLRFLRLEKYRHKNPRDLSTGEKERAALASVMAGRPKILLLDEPTRGLDRSLKRHLGKVLLDFIKECGGTVVVVTQDENFAGEFAGKIIRLDTLSEGFSTGTILTIPENVQ